MGEVLKGSRRWQSAASNVQWKIHPFIGGKYCPSRERARYCTVNPANEISLSEHSIGDVLDVAAAVAAAREAFESGNWANSSPERRATVLFKLADLIAKNRDQLALLDSLEIGKPIQSALFDTAEFAPSLLRSWAGFADKLFGESKSLHGGRIEFNSYEPRGVVGAITPWNFPTVNAVLKIGPALAAGNTVVLKPSELSPSSALKLGELALEAGLPEGVFNIVPGLGSSVGIALARHPGIDFLSFTGSTATGRKVMELAAQSNGKPLMLECGGKSPHVVFDDVEDLDTVAAAAAKSVLWNQGQVCSAHTRLIVHEAIKEDLLRKMLQKLAEFRLGDPLDESTTFGPLASSAQRARVKRFIEAGSQAGAVALVKGAIQETGGCYAAPTVFDGVDTGMSIWQQEIFGPVLCVHTFRTEDDAIELANSTTYGLAATMWTRNMGLGIRLARACKAGHISIRSSGLEEPGPGWALGHEPRGASGFGAELARKGLESYSTLKCVTLSGM